MKVLIVPESNPLAKRVEAYLTEQRVDVLTAPDAAQAIRTADDEKPAAIVAVETGAASPTAPSAGAEENVVDGQQLARDLRDGGVKTPLLVMTGQATSGRAVSVLDSGADDVVADEVELPEVGSRLRALARRCSSTPGGERTIGELHIDPQAARVMFHGRELKLTSREYAVLEFLSRAEPGHFATREAILAACWPSRGLNPKSNVVDVIVGRIRGKLLEIDPIDYIQSSRGRGYRLAAPAE